MPRPAPSWTERVRRALAGPARPRERRTGPPTSANGASSAHLWWDWGGPEPDLVAVEATLEVVGPPVPDRLHFWALQASFLAGGRRRGGGHVGLQVHPGVTGTRAVNWGGYDAAGRELGGTPSPLPSSIANPNTRDLAWEEGVAHRLSITRGRRGWSGAVDGTPVRELLVGGDRLGAVVVWSEVFADCDGPTSAVRWTGLSGTTAAGEEVAPRAVVVGYQEVADGGCSTGSSDPDGAGGVVQRTAVPRATRAGTRLPVG